MTGKSVQDHLENMQYVYSKEKAEKLVEEYETMTITKFNKLYYHKYVTAKSKIRWERKDGLPYVILQSTTLECEQGKNRDRARNEKKRKTDDRKRYKTVLPSKKKDCRATIKLIEVMMFPQYKVPNVDRRDTVVASQRLREALTSTISVNLTQEFRCYIKFPPQSDHSGHVVDQPVDYISMGQADILPTIGRLVADNQLNLEVLKAALESYLGGEQPGSKSEEEQDKEDYRVMEDILNTLNGANNSTPIETMQVDEHERSYVCMELDSNSNTSINYKGNFGSEDTFPYCSCLYYKRTLVPCSHAFTAWKYLAEAVGRTSLSDIYPAWYLKLLQICAPKASESQRRETEALVSEANSYLNRFIQQVQDGRLTLDELKVMNIGYASIKELLPDFTPDDGKFPMRGAIQGVASLQPRRPYITPPINNRSPRLLIDLITNGSHVLSMLRLKSLERELRGKEREKIKAVDKEFREGFLHEDIVNSYLYMLCQTDSRCVYVPTDVLFMLATGHQLNDRETLPTELADKRFIFLPWMPDLTQPMVLLIVDMLTKSLVYLHPLREVDLEDGMVSYANQFVLSKIQPRFEFEINDIVVPPVQRHVKHDLPAPVRNGQDGGFISVLICLYARWFSEDQNLNRLGNDMHVLREHIFDSIVGGCLEGDGSREHCRKCTSTHGMEDRMVSCCRCGQRYHFTCISVDLVYVRTAFVCPTNNLPVDTTHHLQEWGDDMAVYNDGQHTIDGHTVEGYQTVDEIPQI